MTEQVLDLSRTRDRDQRSKGYLDNYIGHRAKIGVIIPSTNTSVEYDCQRVIPRGVTWHFSRFMIEHADLSDDGRLNAYGNAIAYEIAAVFWFQGWNDGVGKGNPDYVEQMVHFIHDLRKDLKVANLPVVIGELGTDGDKAGGWVATFRNQQAQLAAIKNVALARTAQYWPVYPLSPGLQRQYFGRPR